MSESVLKIILWLVSASLVGAMLAIPQPVDPSEMPSLVLDRAAVSDAIDLDQALARELPDSNEVRALRALFLDHGRSEAKPPYERREYDRRQSAIHHATQALIDAHGAPAFAAMRAAAVEDFMDAYVDGSNVSQAQSDPGVVGGFGEILDQYGALVDSVFVAPPLTVRAFYKARWNSIHRRPFVEGFSPIEVQAYWGWLALNARSQPVEKRLKGLVPFRDAEGFGAPEAAALFDLLQGHPDRAANSLNALYEESRWLRLRNFALGVQQTSLLPLGSP